MKQPQLFESLIGYDFDEGYETSEGLTFIDKIMSANLGWDRAYTERVIIEYKKFIYLSIVYGGAAPSDAVDQIWHQHILYTRDYAKFAERFNHTFLHHNPDRLKGNSTHVFDNTVQYYKWEFGIEQPKDIWALEPRHFMRVDLYTNYIIPTGSLASVVKLFFIELKSKFYEYWNIITNRRNSISNV